MRFAASVTFFLSLAISISTAGDKEDLAKHKAVINDIAKKLKFNSVSIVETSDLIVCSSMPETKVKPFADAAQKAVSVARENLKYEKGEMLFSSKLAIYVFTDQSELKMFIRTVEQRRPEMDTYSIVLRGSTPHVAICPDAGTKRVDAELSANAACWAAAAVLNKKIGVTAGASIPEWLQIGYGRACSMRGDSQVKQAAFRSKMKSIVSSRSKTVVWAKSLWDGTKLTDRDLVATSFVEYLAFGPIADKFVGFVRAAKGTPDDDQPTIDYAIASLDTTADNLDVAWKTWIVKGK